MKKILIRADGGEGVGFGHIMRTLVLAKELSQRFHISYVCLEDDRFINGIRKIEDEGFRVFKVKNNSEIEDILKLDGDFILIDKYDIDKKYFEKLKEKFKVFYMDDNNKLDYYPVDLIINQNVYGDMLKYNKSIDTKALVGGKYVLLRDEFINSTPITINKQIKDILITLGGSDDFNITESIIKNLLGLNINLHVIIGPAFKFKETLKCYSDKNIIFYENAIISNVMKKVDMAISSCGSTIYELSFLGVPTIGIIVADNQKQCGQYMEKKECIILKSNIDKSDIENFTYFHRLRLSNNMKKLIDGKGKYRIKEIIEKFDI